MRAEQAEACDAFESWQVPALAGPPRGGVVSVIVSQPVRVGSLFGDAPIAYVSTVPEADGGPMLVLAIRPRGKLWQSVRWRLPPSPNEPPVLASPFDVVRKCAEGLAMLFADSGGPAINADAVAREIEGLNGWTNDLVARLERVLPLPEVREKADRHLCIGPHGPAITYPAMLSGPVEYARLAEYVYVARSRAADPSVRALLAPLWSRSIDKRFDVMEVTVTGESRSIALVHNSVPRAVATWRPRWIETPRPSDSDFDDFLVELQRCCPWPWDQEEVLGVLRDTMNPDPWPAIAKALRMPEIGPFVFSDDWSGLERRVHVIEPASGLKLTVAKMADKAAARIPLGPWVKWRIRLEGRSPHWEE